MYTFVKYQKVNITRVTYLQLLYNDILIFIPIRLNITRYHKIYIILYNVPAYFYLCTIYCCFS